MCYVASTQPSVDGLCSQDSCVNLRIERQCSAKKCSDYMGGCRCGLRSDCDYNEFRYLQEEKVIFRKEENK